jgi:hypothetical protein
MRLRDAWFAVGAVGCGLVLTAVVLIHGGGAIEVLPRLGFTLAFVVVGLVTGYVQLGLGRRVNAGVGLGVIVVAGALLNLLPSFIASGAGVLSLILPHNHVFGGDFRAGVYDPAAAFTSRNSSWPPFTLVLGQPYTLLSANSAYIVHVVILVFLAAATSLLSAKLALKAKRNQRPHEPGRNLTARQLFLLIGLWLVTSYGFLFALERGQFDLFAAFVSLVAVWLLLRMPGSAWPAAACLALAINIKVYPAVLLVLVFWRYRWRAIVPVVVTNVVLLFSSGPSNTWRFLTNLRSMQGHPYFWIGNHSAASFADLVHSTVHRTPSWFGSFLLLCSVVIWAVTMVIVIRRGWSQRLAVLAAAACVPLMEVVPATSHDYTLVWLVFPLAVLTAVVVVSKRDSPPQWAMLFGLLGLEMVFIARSSMLALTYKLEVLSAKFPLLVMLQVLLLAATLVSLKPDGAHSETQCPHEGLTCTPDIGPVI